tara:strand:+ start:2678 stop:3613 length:936 start_codon:yes stop_codon:yes gene_type:complete
MATNFTSLRNNRADLIQKLTAEIKKSASGGQQKSIDERFWKLSVDQKTGIGYAKIRFLIAPKGEEISWARTFSHGFQGPAGGWFIENCPTTLERTCPVCAENNRLWKTDIESNKNIARDRKRKQQWISNILVLEDTAHPENNGKVFLFKYGKKIFDKVNEKLEPQFPDQKPSNPYDLWEGSDFKLKAQKVGGFQNYDKSSFDEPSELFPGDDAAKEAVWEQEYPLQEFLKDTQFKSYEDLEKQLTRALTGEGRKTASEQIEEEAALPVPVPAPSVRSTRAPSPAAKAAPARKVVDEEEDAITKVFADMLED